MLEILMEVSASMRFRHISPDSARHTVDARKGSFDDLCRDRHLSLYLADRYIRDEGPSIKEEQRC